MSEYLFSKMNLKGWSGSEVIRGGKVEITQFDVAASLAFGKLSRPAYYYARTKYCGDKNAEGVLREFLHKAIELTSVKQDWSLDQINIFGMAEIIIQEYVYGVRCKSCKGLGYKIKKSPSEPPKEQVCERCNGSGNGCLSQRKRAKLAGLSLATWHRRWDGELSRFLNLVIDMEVEVQQHLKKQFRKND